MVCKSNKLQLGKPPSSYFCEVCSNEKFCSTSKHVCSVAVVCTNCTQFFQTSPQEKDIKEQSAVLSRDFELLLLVAQSRITNDCPTIFWWVKSEAPYRNTSFVSTQNGNTAKGCKCTFHGAKIQCFFLYTICFNTQKFFTDKNRR